MDMFEKIKSMDRNELARFIWETYHAGNVDGRNGTEDDGPFSCYGGAILGYAPAKYERLWGECYGNDK